MESFLPRFGVARSDR